MKTFTNNEIKEILESHTRWLMNKKEGLRVNFEYADLQGFNFAGANLQNANFRYSNLRRVRFSSANLQDANFEESDLQDAKFQSANVRYANFQGANLQRAFFKQAYIQGINLKNVNFTRSILWGAKYNDQELLLKYYSIGPIGDFGDFLQVFITDKRIELKMDDFIGSMEDFILKLNTYHQHKRFHRIEFVTAIDFIKVISKELIDKR